jgi:hypothetical protein
MSAPGLTWTGFDEFRAELKQLPDALAGEGGKLAVGRANGAASTIKSGYPVRTGKLRDKLVVAESRTRLGTVIVVKNTSKYAKAFDQGHQGRKTALGASRGSMPANPLFSQTVARGKRALHQDLIALVTRHGFTVSGAI